MKLTRSLLALALCFSLSLLAFVALPTNTVTAQEVNAALQRGYRTGYSDGYMAGYRDVIDNATKDFVHHDEYVAANRAYNKDYGAIEDYRDGYRQGFEKGYATGFEKKSFDSAAPNGLAKRGELPPIPTETAAQPIAAAITPTTQTEVPPAETTIPQQTEAAPTTEAVEAVTTPVSDGVVQKVAYQPAGDDPMIIIPRDTELILELQEPIDTERSREGDKFTAKVVAPQEIVGAMIEGRVDKIQKPGRIKKRSALLLSFDRIVINETRWSNFDAIMTEVLPAKGDNIKRVDGEGTAVGKGTFKPDATKVGAATGAGAGIGVLTGGPVGAAVGAGVGAAFGVGAVIIERGKHINLRSNQQLRIKTSYETKIR
ncbi:MAG TPA: hypothetical protein VNA22_05500 [Pyrinomonadaceae bacterium]|nr:hypothetical protein [Pyrinomonadaceae bacterium]